MNSSKYPLERPPVDAPITSSSEDDLGRATVAQEFAQSIRDVDTSLGLVVGILGPWGHGKSSFVNLMREQFTEAPALTVIDFNPWMFSGSNQLVNFFFSEIAAELHIRNKSRFGQAADWLAQYAGILKPVSQFIPFPGAAAIGEASAVALSGIAETTTAEHSANQLRQNITRALTALDEPIVVVIDDIDRLTTNEIREIFKLVRLTASFPNIIYLLAFDRERVERALTEDGIPGRAYLEKIVQLSFDVPYAPGGLLRSRVSDELNQLLAPVTNAALDSNRWDDIYWELIDPFLSNMRDISRYAISVRPTIRNLGSKVDLVDLLVMEALRIFRPNLTHQLSKLRYALTGVGSLLGPKDKEAQKAIDELLTSFPDDAKVIRALFHHVFPAALKYTENNHYGTEFLNIWRTANRMAHIDFFNLYLDRVDPPELLLYRSSEEAFNLLDDGEALKSYLTELNPTEIETVIEGLTSFKDRFTVEMVNPGAVTFLNLIDGIPEKKTRGFFDSGRPEIAVRHVVLHLFECVEDESVREDLSKKILENIETYSSQLALLNILGHREGIGHKLISEASATRLHDDFVAQLQKNPPTNPEREWDAWRIYNTVQLTTGEVPLTTDEDPLLLLAVLRSLKSTARSQTMGSRVVRFEDRLNWDLLLKLFGSEANVADVIRNLHVGSKDDPLLQLADKYLSGWRPNNF